MSQTATNPETGERIELVNGEWVPVQTATNPETGEKVELVGGQWSPVVAPSPEEAPGKEKRKSTLGEKATGLVGGISEAATFGFGDEFEAAIATVIPADRLFGLDGKTEVSFGDYKTNIENIRNRNKKQKEAAPGSHLAGEVAGSLATGGKAITEFGVKKGSALLGAAHATGKAEGNIVERSDNAAIGALFGLGGGIVGEKVISPIAAKVSEKGGGLIRTIITKAQAGQELTKTQRKAVARISKMLKKEGISAEEFNKKLIAAERAGIDDKFLFELTGSQGAQAAKGLATDGNKAAIEGIKKVRARQTVQHMKVDGQLNKFLKSDGSDFLKNSKVLEQAKKKASPLYAEFRRLNGVPVAEAKKVFGSDFDKLLKSAAKAAERRDGKAIKIDGDEISPDLLHRMKVEISKKAQKLRSGGDVGKAGDMTAFEKRIVQYLDDTYPVVYAKARAAYAGPAKQQDAMELGRDLISKTASRRNPENIAEVVARMSPDEVTAFQHGVGRAIRESMKTGNSGKAGDVDFGDPTNLIKKFFGTDEKRDVIKAAFGNEKLFNSFARKMGALDDQAEAFRQVNVQKAGSPTAAREAARSSVIDDIGADAADAAVSYSGKVRALSKLIGGVLRDKKVEEEFASFLFDLPARRQAEIKIILSKLEGPEKAARIAKYLNKPVATVSAVQTKNLQQNKERAQAQ